MRKRIASRSLVESPQREKEGNKSDLHHDRAKILSTENFSPAFALAIFHTSLDRPQDIRFLTRVVKGAVEATAMEGKHDEPPIAKG